MSGGERPGPVRDDERPLADESFLERFHRRKTEARASAADARPPAVVEEAVADAGAAEGDGADPATPTDADMPPLESLTADSDYAGFLSSRVSETLRRAALRKLFHSASFNVVDELDDYAEDFTTFTALGDIVTADMRHRIGVEARRRAEALRQAALDDDAPADRGPQRPDAEAAADDLAEAPTVEHRPDPAIGDQPPGGEET